MIKINKTETTSIMKINTYINYRNLHVFDFQ